MLNADDEAIAEAARVLRAGGLVAFPTETVYGLGALAADAAAVRRIFDAKGRPGDHPLIVHLPGIDHLDAWAASVPPGARALAERFWPGPLTLVLPRSPRVPDAVTGGRDTVALRVPAQPVAARLLAAVATGIAAPSANRFGRVSPTTAAHVAADLGDAVDVVLDGGRCRVGVESTIVEIGAHGPVVLRRGGVPVEEIEEAAGSDVAVEDRGPARAPGMLEAHYAPRAQVVPVEPAAATRALDEHLGARRRVALLGPSAAADAPAGVVALEVDGGDAGYARSLYQRLRDADDAGVDVVVAVLPADRGLGSAVRDRLARAAASSR